MIELVKQCLHKPTRKATLMKQELEDVILDRKKNLSNLPLMLKDVDIPISSIDRKHSNAQTTIAMAEEQFDNDGKVITKRQRYIKRSKDADWNGWNKEFLRSWPLLKPETSQNDPTSA